jgi:hypothetical protein
VAEQEYKRLTSGHVRSGFAVAVTSRCSLWLSHDHLLFIDSNGYTETYKRFYFRDIQAFTVALTRNRLVWNWIWGGLAAICLVVWGAVVLPGLPISVAGLITGASMALLFLVLLLVNNLLGPTCTCQVRTAVQTEELPPLNRLPRARRVLARLRPLIGEAQSQLVLETPLEKTPQAAPATETPAAPAVAPAESGTDPVPPPQVVT